LNSTLADPVSDGCERVLTGALRLEPGGIYVIESEYKFRSAEDLKRFVDDLKKWGQEHGDIQFLLLEPGLKIARAPISPSGPVTPDLSSTARTTA